MCVFFFCEVRESKPRFNSVTIWFILVYGYYNYSKMDHKQPDNFTYSLWCQTNHWKSSWFFQGHSSAMLDDQRRHCEFTGSTMGKAAYWILWQVLYINIILYMIYRTGDSVKTTRVCRPIWCRAFWGYFSALLGGPSHLISRLVHQLVGLSLQTSH